MLLVLATLVTMVCFRSQKRDRRLKSYRALEDNEDYYEDDYLHTYPSSGKDPVTYSDDINMDGSKSKLLRDYQDESSDDEFTQPLHT